MSAMMFQINGISIACSVICSDADQRKHQSFASLAVVRGIHQWPVDSPHKGPATQKMFPFHDVIITKSHMGWQLWIGGHTTALHLQSWDCVTVWLSLIASAGSPQIKLVPMSTTWSSALMQLPPSQWCQCEVGALKEKGYTAEVQVWIQSFISTEDYCVEVHAKYSMLYSYNLNNLSWIFQ